MKSILDLGCRNGALCRQLVLAGNQVAGCDPSSEGVVIARRVVPEARFFNIGVEDDPSPAGLGTYDCVIATEVVEQLYHPTHLPRFAKTVLKPPGYLILSTPYHGYLKNLGLSLLNRWDRIHMVFWDVGHIKFWSEKTLRQLLEMSGFDVRNWQGAGRFWPVWKNMIIVGRKKAEE